jgi:hypothetical protein
MRSPLLALTAISLAALAAGCGADSSGPKIGPPATVVVTTAPAATGIVMGSVGTFAVKVTDASGQAVSGTVVSFSANGGGGIGFAPSSAVTDVSGIASTAVTLGTQAGSATLSASAAGVATPATATVTATPGPLATIITTPESIRLFAVGDTARITSVLQDEFANAVVGATLTFAIADPTLVSVDSAGLVRALRAGGSTSVIVSASGRSDTVSVTVLAAGSSACTGVATPNALTVGTLMTASAATVCLSGGTATSEYTVIAYNSSTDGSTRISATITANGAATPPTTIRIPTSGPLASRSPIDGTASSATPAKVQDLSFHQRLLTESRGLRRLFSAARATRDARLSASRPSSGGRFSPSASYSSIPATVAVGDRLRLNVASSSCTDAIIRGVRVAAIGTTSLVLADTLNPANGFSDADYARFAARFDTLVYPLDTDNFGVPFDMDGNGKIAILFTKYVNELTPANSGSFIGGFFHPRDLFPKVTTNGLQAWVSSNEREMFYMLVPDPTGTVNGNKHTLGFVDTLTTSVLAHEFQHLINASLRLYVNTTAEDFEDTWLNEGISHIAEELLYYHEAAIQPRQNLGDAGIRPNAAKYAIWKADAASNFSRLLDYLADPGGSSPIDDANDELSTRGASWSFLRYSVDRLFPSDAGVWARFTGSTTTGLSTVQAGLLTAPAPILADFALATYIDDLGLSSDPRFMNKSWNFRDIFSNTFGSRATGTFVPLGYYPIRLVGLADNVAATVSVKGGSASYYRVSVPVGGEMLLTFASGQGAPNTSLQFNILRTK